MRILILMSLNVGGGGMGSRGFLATLKGRQKARRRDDLPIAPPTISVPI